jgi:hypothetical protein
MPHKDPEQKKASTRASYLRVKAKDPKAFNKRMAENRRSWRADNRSRALAGERRYREAHQPARAEQCLTRKRDRQATTPKLAWWECTVYSVRSRARARGLPHDLETAISCTLPDLCPILGIALEYGRKSKAGPAPSSPSLDRIRPERGYVPGNVRVISHRANQIRSNATAEELRLVYEDALRLEQGDKV